MNPHYLEPLPGSITRSNLKQDIFPFAVELELVSRVSIIIAMPIICCESFHYLLRERWCPTTIAASWKGFMFHICSREMMILLTEPCLFWLFPGARGTSSNKGKSATSRVRGCRQVNRSSLLFWEQSLHLTAQDHRVDSERMKTYGFSWPSYCVKCLRWEILETFACGHLACFNKLRTMLQSRIR
jgi:hypothetical protein